MAERAPTEAIRANLLSVAHLYDVEARLTARASQHIEESKGLIAEAAALLGRH